MTNAIIKTTSKNSSIVINENEIYWINRVNNNSVKVDFYCSENHADMRRLYNGSRIRPHDCELRSIEPFLRINQIHKELIYDHSEGERYTTIGEWLNTKKH